MSSDYDFQSAYDDYQNGLSAAKEKFDALKEIAALKPEDALQKISAEIAAPLTAHFFSTGINKLINRGTSNVSKNLDDIKSSVQKSGNDALDRVSQVQNSLDDAKATVDSTVDAYKPPDLSITKPFGNLGNNTVSETNIDDAIANSSLPKGVSDLPLEPSAEDFTLSSLPKFPSYDLPTSQWSINDYQLPENMMPQWSSPYHTTYSDDQLDQADDILNGRLNLGADLSNEDFDSLINIRSKLGFQRPEDTPGVSSNKIGDLLRGKPSEPAPPVSEVPQEKDIDQIQNDATVGEQQSQLHAPEDLAPTSTNFDQASADEVGDMANLNLATIQKVDGISRADAEDVVQTGATQVRGNELLGADGQVLETTGSDLGAGLTDTAAAGLEGTGEALAESTGAETEGIGALVGGAIALGGVLASVFSHHKSTPTQQVPNLSVPVFTPGLT